MTKGYKKVTLSVAADHYEFAKRVAAHGNYFSAEDCLNAVLNMALLRWREEMEEIAAGNHGLQAVNDDRRGQHLRVVEDVGGHARLVDRDDLDDDIPF